MKLENVRTVIMIMLPMFIVGCKASVTVSPTVTTVIEIPTSTSTATLESIITSTITQSLPEINTLTPTDTIVPSSTATQITCPPFEIDREIPEPNSPENYIGRHYSSKAMPEGMVFHMWASILGSGDYSVEEVTSKKTLHMLWMLKLVCRNDQGKAFHEILDVAVLPPLAENEMLATQYCSIGDQSDPEIVAIGKYECGASQLTEIEYAWRVNRQTERIEIIPVDNVKCGIELGDCIP